MIKRKKIYNVLKLFIINKINKINKKKSLKIYNLR